MKKHLILVLIALSVCRALAQQSTPMQPFVIDHRNTTGSTIDLSQSDLNEKPAGKRGFVRAEKGHFVVQTDKRVKFWGVNITDWTRGSTQIPNTKEEADLWAKTLARYGVNIVRLTFLDFYAPRGIIDGSKNDTRHLDAAEMDKFDYWVAALKKNGIYSDFNLLVGRNFKEGDGVKDYGKAGWAKFSAFFDGDIIKLEKEFAQQLLTHLNPYTKTEYRNEPAVAIVELVNENTLFDGWNIDALHPLAPGAKPDPNFRNITPYQSDLLTKMFNTWLSKTRTPGQVAALKKQAGVSLDSLVPRIRKSQAATAPKELYYATIRYYTEQEKSFFNGMRAYLMDTLHVNNMLLGSNDFLHNMPLYPMVESNSALDMLDGHVYWQHPNWPGKINTPMVNEPDSSTIVGLARTAMAGKPYTVTEVNHAHPNDYQAEGIPLLAAYAAMQDWDAVMWYTFEPKSDPAYQGAIGDAFDISHSPIKMPELAAGALMFLRGDVSPAKETVLRNYSREQIYETMRMPDSEADYYTKDYPATNALEHQVRIGDIASKDKQPPFKPVTDNPLVSDTKELAWYTNSGKDGFVSVETPKSQALIGFVKANKKSVKNLSADVENDFCAITLSSLDGKPITRSGHMLLVTAAKTENTGQTWNATHTKSVQRGASPSLIEVVKGTITLKNVNNTGVIVQPLDGAGKSLGQPIPVTKTADGIQFKIGDTATTWYEIKGAK